MRVLIISKVTFAACEIRLIVRCFPHSAIPETFGMVINSEVTHSVLWPITILPDFVNNRL